MMPHFEIAFVLGNVVCFKYYFLFPPTFFGFIRIRLRVLRIFECIPECRFVGLYYPRQYVFLIGIGICRYFVDSILRGLIFRFLFKILFRFL